MTLNRQKLAPIFVFLVAILLAVSARSNFDTKLVSANAQDQSRSDAKPLPKKAKKPAKGAHVAAAPANDNCASAIAVATCPFADSRDTTDATDESGEAQSTCTLQASSVWYSYSAGPTNSAIVTVSTCNSDYDTAISVWQVDPAQPCNFATFIAVGCNDDFCGDGFQSTATFTANPGAQYKIQIGGFDGDTGTLNVNVACQVITCPQIVINGTLGSGDPAFSGTQSSGDQTGRLNRNGVGSSCAAPKTCSIFDPVGLRKYDAYQIPNQSGQDQCVSIGLSAPANTTCNVQSNAYLDTYTPGSICAGYLGDPGLSTGVPPTPTTFSVTVPAGHTLIVVVHTTNPGEVGCPYTVTVFGNLCPSFDICLQDDTNPGRVVQISSVNGNYKYQDCSKGITLQGTGVVTKSFCKTELIDRGPNPKRPDRFVDVLVNPCTKVGEATIQFGGSTITLRDRNITNSTCGCSR